MLAMLARVCAIASATGPALTNVVHELRALWADAVVADPPTSAGKSDTYDLHVVYRPIGPDIINTDLPPQRSIERPRPVDLMGNVTVTCRK